MNGGTVYGIVAAALFLAACSHLQGREAAYLDEVKGRATQAEIKQELGSPKSVRQGEAGETIWVYELWEQQSGNRLTAPGMWCEEYRLIFDATGLFRRWRQLSHFHGGELMPTECIPEDQTLR
ncbi:MAG: hypothetical protein L6Q38_09290 [Nitrospira sp.]|nr:hypothetical protein [Nitrospira sp.]